MSQEGNQMETSGSESAEESTTDDEVDDRESIAESQAGAVCDMSISNKDYFLGLIEQSQNWELKNQEETRKLLEKFSKDWKTSHTMRDPKNTYELVLALTHIRDVGKMLLHQTSSTSAQNFDVNLYTDALYKLGVNEETEEYSVDQAAEVYSELSWKIRKKVNKMNNMPSFSANQIQEIKEKKDKALELKASKPKAVRIRKVFDETKVKNYNEMTKISNEERVEMEEKSTTSICQNVYKILKAHLKEKNVEEISLVEFAMEKTFEETLNNLFYLFFLTKDGLIGARSVAQNQDQGTQIEHLIISAKEQKKPAQNDKNDGSERFSMVMAFDMKTWKNLLQNFNTTYSGSSLGIIGKQLYKK